MTREELELLKEGDTVLVGHNGIAEIGIVERIYLNGGSITCSSQTKYSIPDRFLSVKVPIYIVKKVDINPSYAVLSRTAALTALTKFKEEPEKVPTMNVSKNTAVVDLGGINGPLNFRNDLEDLIKDDIVVVETRFGLKVGTVVEVSDQKSRRSLATKWVIQKVDLTEHNNRIARLQELEQLKKEAILRRDFLLEQQTLEDIAAKTNDPELVKILDRMKELGY